MARKQSDPSIAERIVALRRASAHPPSFAVIGRKLGISADSAQKIYAKQRLLEQPLHSSSKLDPPLTIEGNVAIVGDIHVNTTKWDLLNTLVSMSQKAKVNQIAIVGDLFNNDAFSKYDKTGHESPWGAELASARSIISFMFDHYQTVYFCRGNHDQRWFFQNHGEVSMTTLGDLLAPNYRERLKTTDYNYMYANSKSGRWMLAHQFQYSRNQLAVAKRLASRYQCHVVTHHEHHAAAGFSDCGKYAVINNGCLADPSITPYKALNASDLPEWKLGFGHLIGGHWHQYIHGAPWGDSIGFSAFFPVG
jgi:hypothetical protein